VKLSVQQAAEARCIETSRLPQVLGNGLRDGGMTVGFMRRPCFTTRVILLSVRHCVNPRVNVRLEGLGKLKISVTSRIEIATFRVNMPKVPKPYTHILTR
jgi:hypothetical protein